MLAFGGKEDMALASQNVRLWPMPAKRLILQGLSFPVFQCFTIFVRRAFLAHQPKQRRPRRLARVLPLGNWAALAPSEYSHAFADRLSRSPDACFLTCNSLVNG